MMKKVFSLGFGVFSLGFGSKVVLPDPSRSGQTQMDLDRLKQTWMDQDGPGRTRTDQDGPGRTRTDPDGPGRTRTSVTRSGDISPNPRFEALDFGDFSAI